MKFPRNAKILRSHFDVAPFASVFFLLLIFLLFGTLVPTPGIPLQPPSASGLPGVDTPCVDIGLDANGTLYYNNQMITNANERILITDLMVATNSIHEPLTVVIHADKSVSYEQIAHLTLLARDCGITNAVLATLPRVESVPAKP
jgi:biopolymer transport protein ExbD